MREEKLDFLPSRNLDSAARACGTPNVLRISVARSEAEPPHNFRLVRHEVAISTVIHELREITLRSAASTLPRRASLVTAGCEALGTM
jgi:hypothetical protein